jgi:hypothetical protein
MIALPAGEGHAARDRWFRLRSPVVPLDPIVSLSVALAEAPGTCAFFLGSGVSRDAGVPTGYEVMRDGLRKLHNVENPDSEPVDDEALDAWLAKTGREHMTYSDLLAAITPDAAVRREYLASFFEGKEPGPTHEALAALADRGLVRVFVTTNFDRLLEHALQARGIEPVVIASDADLEAAMPREHASCVVLKPHGDYLRETIRNTPEELAELDPAVTAELGEVFSRYGIVVLGYSGADEGIARALRGRRSRFGVWWVVRGELGQPAAELVEAIGARVVRRDSAVEFLADLERRLAVFEEHPSGLTPAATHDGVLAMLRAGDGVGLDDLLRRERHDYESELDRLTADALARYGTLTEDVFRKVWSALRPVLERRLASLLPLALHAPERFAGEVEHAARSLERRPQRGGLTLWIELPEFAAAWLAYVCGGLLVRLDQYEALRPLLETTWTDANGRARPLIQFAGETSHGFGGALAPTGQRWLAPGWEFLTRSLESADWLRERYPELFAEGEPRAGMSQFDVLVCIYHATHDQYAVAFFALDRASIAFALRAHRDPRLRERLAAVAGLSLEEFDAQAPQALRDAARFQGGFTTQGETASALETGSAF